MSEEIKKDETNKELQSKVLEKFQEMMLLEETEGMIVDNKITFKHKEKSYRVRVPTLKERQEVNEKRGQKIIEMLRDKKFVPQEEMIKLYKQNGIDIKALDADMVNVQKKIDELLIRLATETDEKSVTALKFEIVAQRNTFIELSMKRTDLMKPSVESQMMQFIVSYFTYLIFEEEIKENEYKRVYASFNGFMESQDDSNTKAIYYANLILSEVGNDK